MVNLADDRMTAALFAGAEPTTYANSGTIAEARSAREAAIRPLGTRHRRGSFLEVAATLAQRA